MNKAQIYLLNAGIDDVIVSDGDDPDPENWKYLSDVMGEYHLSAVVLTRKSSGQEKVGDIWTNEDESAEIERQIIEDARR